MQIIIFFHCFCIILIFNLLVLSVIMWFIYLVLWKANFTKKSFNFVTKCCKYFFQALLLVTVNKRAPLREKFNTRGEKQKGCFNIMRLFDWELFSFKCFLSSHTGIKASITPETWLLLNFWDQIFFPCFNLTLPVSVELLEGHRLMWQMSGWVSFLNSRLLNCFNIFNVNWLLLFLL